MKTQQHLLICQCQLLEVFENLSLTPSDGMSQNWVNYGVVWMIAYSDENPFNRSCICFKLLLFPLKNMNWKIVYSMRPYQTILIYLANKRISKLLIHGTLYIASMHHTVPHWKHPSLHYTSLCCQNQTNPQQQQNFFKI